MRELTQDTLMHIAGGCGEVNEICQTIFLLSTNEEGTKLPAFLGLLLMFQHCTSDEVQILLAEYEATKGVV